MAEPNVQISMCSCPKCRSVAKVEVSAFRPARQVLVPEMVVAGPQVVPLVDFMSTRDAAHEARYEQANA